MPSKLEADPYGARPPPSGALLTDSVTILARYFQGCYRPWDTLRALAPGLLVCPPHWYQRVYHQRQLSFDRPTMARRCGLVKDKCPKDGYIGIPVAWPPTSGEPLFGVGFRNPSNERLLRKLGILARMGLSSPLALAMTTLMRRLASCTLGLSGMRRPSNTSSTKYANSSKSRRGGYQAGVGLLTRFSSSTNTPHKRRTQGCPLRGP